MPATEAARLYEAIIGTGGIRRGPRLIDHEPPPQTDLNERVRNFLASSDSDSD